MQPRYDTTEGKLAYVTGNLLIVAIWWASTVTSYVFLWLLTVAQTEEGVSHLSSSPAGKTVGKLT